MKKSPFIDAETKALFDLGFIVAIDYAYAVSLALLTFGSFVWIVTARPDFVYIMAMALVAVLIFCVWLLTLIYRCCFFVLKMRAIMETMPEQAAKIAFSIYQQKVNEPKATTDK